MNRKRRAAKPLTDSELDFLLRKSPGIGQPIEYAGEFTR
jgi:hypothetical protein